MFLQWAKPLMPRYVLIVECPRSYLGNCLFHSEKNAAKNLLKRFPSHSGTVKTKLSMFFPESKPMFLFWQNRRLKLFLFPSEILGWCSSAYDFTVRQESRPINWVTQTPQVDASRSSPQNFKIWGRRHLFMKSSMPQCSNHVFFFAQFVFFRAPA